MEKLLILGLRQKIHKVSLEHFAVPENKEVCSESKTMRVYVLAQAALTKYHRLVDFDSRNFSQF